MLYVPVSFVSPVETTPVSVFVAVMLTPGISAFDASETVPLKLALLDWPKVGTDRLKQRRHIANAKKLLITLDSSPVQHRISSSTRTRTATRRARVQRHRCLESSDSSNRSDSTRPARAPHCSRQCR